MMSTRQIGKNKGMEFWGFAKKRCGARGFSASSTYMYLLLHPIDAKCCLVTNISSVA